MASELIAIDSRAIRMNILINPTGRPGKFRAVDWAVELLNLFTKVCSVKRDIGANTDIHQVTHSGRFSNKSVEHILNESPLIETYRHLHDTFGESFCISKKTSSNHGPNMMKTYTEILNAIKREDTHRKVIGRKSELDAADLVNKGIASILAASKNTMAEGTTEESDDVQPETLDGEGEVELDSDDLTLDEN